MGRPKCLPMDCLHCGKKLSMVKKLTTGEFCSAAHKKAYLQEQEKFALARLLENQDRLGGKAPGSEKPDLDKVAADAIRARAAKRALRVKVQPEEVVGTPAECDFLPEQIKASEGPTYLALPDSRAEMEIEPILPEFGVGVETGVSAEGPAHGDGPSPFVAVHNRFGLEAIFGSSVEPEIDANFQGLPEFLPYKFDSEILKSVPVDPVLWECAVQTPRPALGMSPDWHEAPARRKSEEWERAIDQLAEADPCSQEGLDLQWAVHSVGAGEGSSLEAFGPKRFAFSRLPELSVAGIRGEAWDLAGGLPWDALAEIQLEGDCLGEFAAMAFEPGAVCLLAGSGKWEWRKSGSIHELAQALDGVSACEKVSIAKSSASVIALRGLSEEFEGSFGAVQLPDAARGYRQGHLDEAVVRFEGEGLGAIYEPKSLAAKQPRGPYDLSMGNRYFPPPPRIASVPRAASPLAQPPLVTRLVAIEIPSGSGAAVQARLRAHGEVSLTRGALLLPKIKHKIRPVILDDSFYAALGQLTAGNRDFSIAGLKKHWNLAPNDIRWVAMAVPIVLGLVWYSSSGGGNSTSQESLASTGGSTGRVEATIPAQPSEPGLVSKIFGDDSMVEMKRSIQRRAAVELSDDFRQGLGEWSGVGDWARGWSYDRAGFLRPRQIGFYTPSMELTDYRFEFLGQIERKALSWVFRAADARNYYVNRLEIVGPGPIPVVVLVRYAVVGGVAGARTVTRLPMQVQMDTLYRIRVDVQGSNFVTTIQGQVVDVFSDERITRGGVGFFAGAGEDVRLRWVEVSHQYDFLGRLCAFLVPYNVSK